MSGTKNGKMRRMKNDESLLTTFITKFLRLSYAHDENGTNEHDEEHERRMCSLNLAHLAHPTYNLSRGLETDLCNINHHQFPTFFVFHSNYYWILPQQLPAVFTPFPQLVSSTFPLFSFQPQSLLMTVPNCQTAFRRILLKGNDNCTT